MTGDDCDSLVWDCVQGTCKPNYCYAAGTLPLPDSGMGPASLALTVFQQANGGLPISGDPHVLFNPCTLDAGYPTACLPQYDSLTNASTGICVRVGGAQNGGWGAVCDPSPNRNNSAGLCRTGTYCDKGTCLPWCDLGTSAFLQCPSDTTCSRLPPGALSSTPSGITNSIGVCAEACNPYFDATANTCLPFAIDGGVPPLVCKFSESQTDSFPSPGICVAGVASPIAVGLPCEPFGWLDPCVSGAQCESKNSGDGGPAFECSQLCDPVPSPGITTPACPTGTTCQASQSCAQTGGCSHEGWCQ